MIRAALAAGALACLAAVSGCSSEASGPGPADFSGEAYATATSDSQALKVEVHMWPDPPVRGTNQALLVVTDVTTGEPRDGLDVQIQPWMPAMNHGAIAPTIEAQGEGKYLVTNLSLFMPGLWALRTTLAGAATDHAVPQFQVP